MRLKPDRPDLADYARFFDAPTAVPRSLLHHRALPSAGDDLDVSMRVLTRLATADSVSLHLPTLWEPADPWA